MTSASACIHRAYKTANYCLIYHVSLTLTLKARCVRFFHKCFYHKRLLLFSGYDCDINIDLSHDVMSLSDIMPCIKIDNSMFSNIM